MEPNEINALLEKVRDEVKSGVKSEIENATKGLVTADQFKTRLDEMGVDKASIDKLTAAVEKQGEKLNEIASRGARTPKTLRDVLTEKMPELEKSANTKTKLIFDVPVSKTTVTAGSSITTDPGGYIIPGFGDMALPFVGLEKAFTTISLPANHHGTIRYTDQTTYTKNAAMTSEAAQSTDSAYAWTGYSATVEKALATIPVSYEALKDITEMEATIRRLITAELVQVKETQLYTGTGVAPQVNGLYTKGTTFDYASWTGITTLSANIYDLCMLLKTEIVRQYGSKFMPNFVALNPADALKAKWVKNADGDYIRNPFVSPDGSSIAGLTIIESPAVTANTLVLGDSRYANLYLGDSVEIEVGYDGNNFSYDLVMVKARHRFATVIRNVDAYGFYKVADVTAALTAITTAGA